MKDSSRRSTTRTGSRSLPKQRTVNPPIVPARYNFLHASSRPALRAAACGGHRGTGLTSLLGTAEAVSKRLRMGDVTRFGTLRHLYVQLGMVSSCRRSKLRLARLVVPVGEGGRYALPCARS